MGYVENMQIETVQNQQEENLHVNQDSSSQIKGVYMEDETESQQKHDELSQSNSCLDSDGEEEDGGSDSQEQSEKVVQSNSTKYDQFENKEITKRRVQDGNNASVVTQTELELKQSIGSKDRDSDKKFSIFQKVDENNVETKDQLKNERIEVLKVENQITSRTVVYSTQKYSNNNSSLDKAQSSVNRLSKTPDLGKKATEFTSNLHLIQNSIIEQAYGSDKDKNYNNMHKLTIIGNQDPHQSSGVDKRTLITVMRKPSNLDKIKRIEEANLSLQKSIRERKEFETMDQIIKIENMAVGRLGDQNNAEKNYRIVKRISFQVHSDMNGGLD